MEIKVDNIKIDKYQKKVVKCKADNLMVLAGAGTGKTFTIVAKIKKIIHDGICPSQILCISFTKKSATSLENKLIKNGIHIRVKTFHSLGYEIISKYKKVELANEKELRKIILRNIIKTKGISNLINLKFNRFGKEDKIFEKLEDNMIINSVYIDSIIKTIETFINLYKGQNNNIKKFKEYNIQNQTNHIYEQKKRHKLFLNLTKKTIIDYNKYLKKHKQIDYHDMINLAIKIISKQSNLNYKYIIIDEYQDISLNKIKLIKEIQDKTNSKLIVVGDDWQSIYGFTGSNLGVLINFKKIFPHSKLLKLKKTYRNSKELLKITSNFICKNPYQLRKKLKSDKINKYPIKIYYYDNNKKEIYRKLIYKLKDTKLLIIGRNNNDINNFSNNNAKYLTAHKSKGLETENTIIINLENSYIGFPSKLRQSEYLKYVQTSIDNYPYAEERRLFYVALTRCTNSNYLLVDINNPSIFVIELIKKYKKYIEFDNFN